MTKVAEDHEEPAEVQDHVLHEGYGERGRRRVAAELDQRVTGDQRDDGFQQQADTAGKTAGGLLGDFQIIVIKSDEAEAERHRQHDPDIGVERIGPQQRRDHEAGQDHQPAHGRRAALGDDVRLRAVGADRLALALAQAQVIDDPRPEQEHEQRAGRHRAAGAEGDVAEDVERRAEPAEAGRKRVGKLDQPVEHTISALSRGLIQRRLAGKALFERIHNDFHLRAQRSLDHDRIPRTHRRHHLRFQVGRTVRIAAPFTRR